MCMNMSAEDSEEFAREEVWRAKARAKIKKGMASLLAGRTVSAEEAFAKVEARITEIERRRTGRV